MPSSRRCVDSSRYLAKNSSRTICGHSNGPRSWVCPLFPSNLQPSPGLALLGMSLVVFGIRSTKQRWSYNWSESFGDTLQLSAMCLIRCLMTAIAIHLPLLLIQTYPADTELALLTDPLIRSVSVPSSLSLPFLVSASPCVCPSSSPSIISSQCPSSPAGCGCSSTNTLTTPRGPGRVPVLPSGLPQLHSKYFSRSS